MPPRESSIVGAAGEAVIAAARESAGADLRTVVVYDQDDYEVRYIADWIQETLGEERVRETTEQLHGYVHLDFVERELYADLTPVAGTVRTNITRLERATFVRYLVGDAGIFLSVDPSTDLTALCTAMDEALEAATEDAGDR